MRNEPSELLDLRRLRHLVAVAEAGSFTAAADELSLSQPGLSSSIQRLEVEIGMPLLERATRGVRPTPAGFQLVQAARGLLATAGAARARLQALAGLTAGVLSIGSVQTFSSIDLAELLAQFHRRHPGVQINLHEDTTTGLLHALSQGELDLAFVALDDEPLPGGLRKARSYTEELVLITGPGSALAERGEMALPELAGEAFVDFQAGVGLQTVIEQTCLEAGLRRRIAFGASQMNMVLALVRHQLGVAIVPAPVAQNSGLPTVRLPGISRRLALLVRAGGPGNPAARALLGLL